MMVLRYFIPLVHMLRFSKEVKRMEVKNINGVNVAIIGLNKLNGRFSVVYTLNGYELFEWVKKDLFAWARKNKAKYKLQSTKADFIADATRYCTRCFVDIESNVEYLEFLRNLYDYLQDYLRTVK